MTYKYVSQTSSGWIISKDPDAEPDKRWRAEHVEPLKRISADPAVYATRYARTRYPFVQDIMAEMAKLLAEWVERRFGEGDAP
jgi:hypothetical protein